MLGFQPKLIVIGAYFKSDDTKTAQDYHRQNTLGYGPEVVSLDELNKYLAE